MPEPPSPVQEPSLKPPSRVRLGVLAGLAFAAAGAYLTRVCISPAATSIQKEFGFSDSTMGVVLAAFFMGYTWLQIPGGWAANRWGSRLVMPILSVVWSLCSLWSGLSVGFASLWTSRFMGGVAQAGLVPCSAKVVMDWVPASKRGASSAVVATSMSVGGVIATALTAALLPVLGWRGVFNAYTLFGLVWAAAFWLWFRDRPEEHPTVNAGELRLIRGEPVPGAEKAAPAGGSAGRGNKDVLLALLLSAGMWLICGQAFCRAFGAAFFTTWFPAFLEKGRGVKLESAGLYTVLPLLGTVIGNTLGGTVVDRLLARTNSKYFSRCGTSMFALALCALCTLAASTVRDPLLAVGVLAVGSAFFGLGSPAAWAATMDVSGKHTAVCFGIMNMAGNLGAIVCPVVVGQMFDTIKKTQGDWNWVLYLFVGIYLLGALFWGLLNPNRSVVERRAPAGQAA